MAMVFAYTGAVLVSILAVSQISRTVVGRNIEGLSALSWSLQALCAGTFLVYGFRTFSDPQVVGNVLPLLGAGLVAWCDSAQSVADPGISPARPAETAGIFWSQPDSGRGVLSASSKPGRQSCARNIAQIGEIADPPPGITAYRFLYVSQTQSDKNNIVSALFAVRSAPAGGPNGRPLLAVAHGTTGNAPGCGVSQAPFTPWIDRLRHLEPSHRRACWFGIRSSRN